MISLKTILAATDFSETSNIAMTHAKALADKFSSSLHLLHVLPDPHAQAWSIEMAGVRLDPGDRGQIAFAIWEGSQHEVGSRKMRTVWIPLTVEEGLR